MKLLLEKGLDLYQRATFYLAKGHLDNPKGQVEVDIPLPNWKVFFKKGTFQSSFRYPDTFYLSEIGPAFYL